MSHWTVLTHNRKKIKTCFYFAQVTCSCWLQRHKERKVRNGCFETFSLKDGYFPEWLRVVPTPSSQGGMSYSGVISSPLHPPSSEGQTGCTVFSLPFISEHNTFFTVKQLFEFLLYFLNLKAENNYVHYYITNIHNHGKIQVFIYFRHDTVSQHFSNMLYLFPHMCNLYI